MTALFAEGRRGDVMSLPLDGGISEQDRKSLDAIHPMFMGVNSLHDAGEGVVEIPCIRITSITFDVTSVYVGRDRAVTCYRVVDECGGEMLEGSAEMDSRALPTLGGVADFCPNLDALGRQHASRHCVQAVDDELGTGGRAASVPSSRCRWRRWETV